MRSLTVFVMLDACRPDYIKKKATPFLHDLADSGFSGPVKPAFGFEPDAAYLAGLYPDQSDSGAQFWHNPEQSPFAFTKTLPKMLNRLPEIPQKLLRKLLLVIAGKNSNSPNLSTARIPFHLLHRFAPTLFNDLDHPRFTNTYSIFDLLRRHNKAYLFHAAPKFRVTAEAAFKRAVKELFPPLEFAFFHLGNLDRAGHAYGPSSTEIQRELYRVDKKLKNIYELANKRFFHVNMVIMGDHGMVEISNHLDMEALLKKRDIVNGRDCLYLLDSTMARFWVSNQVIRKKIVSALEDVNTGRILTQKDLDFYHLNWPHNRFGDLIFLANPGTLLFPNHYQQIEPVKGMHGYDPEFFGQQAALIINGPNIPHQQKPIPSDMRRVFPTLCSLMDIDRPGECGLESLVKS